MGNKAEQKDNELARGGAQEDIFIFFLLETEARTPSTSSTSLDHPATVAVRRPCSGVLVLPIPSISGRTSRTGKRKKRGPRAGAFLRQPPTAPEPSSTRRLPNIFPLLSQGRGRWCLREEAPEAGRDRLTRWPRLARWPAGRGTEVGWFRAVGGTRAGSGARRERPGERGSESWLEGEPRSGEDRRKERFLLVRRWSV
ncbi:hypothetical protein NL676_029515 [Syzygium grande]|nr:hypothetical protein NL676_029515 [Syzygium grande]